MEITSEKSQNRPQDAKRVPIHFETGNYKSTLQPKGFPPLPSDWTSDWESFPSADGKVKLYSVFHHPKKGRRSSARAKAKGQRILVVLHGLGEHGGRYHHFPHFLQDEVDGIYCLDHQGHGRSEGLRGHIERFDIFAEDVAHAIRRLYDYLKTQGDPFEIHFFGHSLGGLIGLRTLFVSPDLHLQSATISAPLLGIKSKIPWPKKAAAGIMARVWGSLQLDNELDPRGLSHDPELVAAYQADRLVHSKVTPLLFREMQQAMADMLKQSSGLKLPLQLLVPLKDVIVDADLALSFFHALSHSDKSLKTYPEFFHESFNELGKEQPFEDLKKWIKTHSKI